MEDRLTLRPCEWKARVVSKAKGGPERFNPNEYKPPVLPHAFPPHSSYHLLYAEEKDFMSSGGTVLLSFFQKKSASTQWEMSLAIFKLIWTWKYSHLTSMGQIFSRARLAGLDACWENQSATTCRLLGPFVNIQLFENRTLFLHLYSFEHILSLWKRGASDTTQNTRFFLNIAMAGVIHRQVNKSLPD